MNKIIQYIPVILLLLLGSSCVSIEKTVVNKLSQYGPPYDAEWHKELVNARAQIKESWIKYFDMDLIVDFPKSVGNIIGITERDVAKATCVPVEFFRFPTSTFFAWKPEDPIEPNLILLKDKVYCLMAKKDVFFRFGCANMKNNNWEVVAGGNFYEFRSEKLSELYFKKKIPIIIVCVTEENDGWIGNYTFFAFKENGVLKCVDREKIRPLSDVMKEYQ